MYEYRSPGVTFESDKLTDEEIEQLSGEVKTYYIKIKKDKDDGGKHETQ